MYLKELDWVCGEPKGAGREGRGGIPQRCSSVTDCSWRWGGGGASLVSLSQFSDFTFSDEFSKSFSSKWATAAQEVTQKLEVQIPV